MRNGLALVLFFVSGVAVAAPECVLVRDGVSTTEVRMETSGPVVSFAAGEIQRYLKQMSGADVEIVASIGGGTQARAGRPPLRHTLDGTSPIVLSLDPALGPDAFHLSVTRKGVRIAGGNDRGVLYGTYQMLESLGCRFLAPGSAGENVPQARTLSLGTTVRTFQPALRYRGLIVQQPLSEGNLVMADWMAKNRMNYWVNPYWQFLSAEPDLKRRFAEALEKRGILWEFGHHTFTQWITEGGLTPDVRGLKGGVRTTAAICISKPEAAEKVARNMANFVAQYPQVDVLSLWPNDTFDGWCECNECKLLYGELPMWREGIPLMTRPYFWFVERVAEILTRLGVRQPVSALAYNNTIEMVTPLPLRDNVQVTVAPIGRDYSRPIADLDYFGPILSDWTGLLGEKSSLAPLGARVMTYEYYAGMYANNSLPMPTVTALSDDVAGYQQTGFGGITTQAEEGHWGVYGLDFYALARMSYNGPQVPGRLIAGFSRDYYGAASAPMTEYWNLHEELIRSQGEVRPIAGYFSLLRTTPGAIERLDQLVARAEMLADTEVIRARVHLTRLSIDYVKALRDAIEAGRGQILDLLAPTPKGTGHLGPIENGGFVQIRIPVSRAGNVRVSLGNVVAMEGGGSSYQLEVRRDASTGVVIHTGAVFSGTAQQAAQHTVARDWASDNGVPLDVTEHLTAVDFDRGWLDLFVTATVTGDTWTVYRDRDDAGPWDMEVSVTSDDVDAAREEAWQRLADFVQQNAQSGIFVGSPEFVLGFCRKIVDQSR